MFGEIGVSGFEIQKLAEFTNSDQPGGLSDRAFPPIKRSALEIQFGND
jgi:hypothetical protein